MDGQLTPPSHPTVDAAKALPTSGAMPVDAPLDMPVQDRRRAPQVDSPDPQRPATWFARLIATAATLGIAGALSLAIALDPAWPMVPMVFVTPLVTFTLNRQWVFA